MRHEQARPRPTQVEFEGKHGPVSDTLSDAILERLEGPRGDTDILEKHLAYEQAVNANSPLVLGNKVTLLQNGPATYAAMFAAIDAAKDSINLESYIFADDEAGQQFAERLLARQAAGVQVNVIYDSIGAVATPVAFFERLRAAGVQLLEFNPLNPLEVNTGEWSPNHRDHRKQLIVDGRIAFTGGINISSAYSSSPLIRRAITNQSAVEESKGGWRDTHIQIEGPVVAEFQKLFLETWAKQHGAPLAARDYYPELEPRGHEIVRAIGSTPDDPQRLIYLTLMSAISHARYSLHLTIAYFAPDPQLMEALITAAQRGVDVVLVLPSYSDSSTIINLGRSYYSELLKYGVKISQRRGALMHAKTACIDGVWSTIGSTNLDWRSFLHNDEVNAVILGRDFATQMETMFTQDLQASEAITLRRWQLRSPLQRLKEQLARLGEYWL